METPASLDNGEEAALCIQRAFRGMQRRIAADEEDLQNILNTLEEAEESRINAREGVMSQVNKTLERFIGNVGKSLRGGHKSSSTAEKLKSKSLSQRGVLPTLTAGSIANLVQGLGRNERVAMVDAVAILKAAAVMFMEGASVCNVEVPKGGKCIVVGDLHGQLVRETRVGFVFTTKQMYKTFVLLVLPVPY